MQLVDNLLSNIYQNGFTGILFVDFAMAFEVIDHSLLLGTLDMYQLAPKFPGIISCYRFSQTKGNTLA